MVYQHSDPTDDAKLAYDLRQIYAKLVGEHLIDVATNRKGKNYPAYFEALEDLYITTKHNFKINKKEKKNFTDLKKDFINIANEHREAYLGTSQDTEELGKIKTALNNIELYLWKKIKEAKMIGTRDSEEGLL